MRKRRHLVPHFAMFALLSGADLFLTWRLLGRGLPSVSEYNPVAAWVLGQFGWYGLTAFKATAAAVVVAAALAIAARRPRAASGVLVFGWVTLAAVVFYGAGFADIHRALGNSAMDDDAALAARRTQLDDGIVETVRLREFKRQLTDGMIAGRLDFRAAVERLAASEFGEPARRWNRLRRIYGLDSVRDCCAANLFIYALGEVQDDAARWRQWTSVWLSDYRSHYRVSTPPPWEWDTAKHWPPLAGNPPIATLRAAALRPPSPALAAQGDWVRASTSEVETLPVVTVRRLLAARCGIKHREALLY